MPDNGADAMHQFPWYIDSVPSICTSAGYAATAGCWPRWTKPARFSALRSWPKAVPACDPCPHNALFYQLTAETSC